LGTPSPLADHPAGHHERLWHQERAVRAIHTGQTTLVSTGTGSGKTECFLYPIVRKCTQLKDANAPADISAVIVLLSSAQRRRRTKSRHCFLAMRNECGSAD
jgi:ATP-dependent helicase YprA (DUF1998 family)